MSIIRPGKPPTPAPVNEGQHVVVPLPEAPTITTELVDGGRRLTCPAGHTLWHKGRAMAEILAPWVVGHETHIPDDPDTTTWTEP